MKYNEFGEVISVNGLTTGQHIGMPLQDACPAKPEDNEPYAIAKQTVGNCENTPCDVQPKPMGGALSWNDLKDKPFYTETETFTILENYPVTEEQTDDYGDYYVMVTLPTTLREGDNVIVDMHGTQYEERVRKYYNGWFGASCDPDGDGYLVFSLDQTRFTVGKKEGTGNVTVTVVRETVKKLDKKHGGCLIEDISDRVFDGDFDFTAVGTGMYFSSKQIRFHYKEWDANFEETGSATQYLSGLFLVDSDSPMFRVMSVGTFATFQLMPGTVYDGTYDMCGTVQGIIAGQE